MVPFNVSIQEICVKKKKKSIQLFFVHHTSSPANGRRSQLSAVLILNYVKVAALRQRSRVKCLVDHVTKENDVTFFLWDFLIAYPLPVILISILCYIARSEFLDFYYQEQCFLPPANSFTESILQYLLSRS